MCTQVTTIILKKEISVEVLDRKTHYKSKGEESLENRGGRVEKTKETST
jgi:hypothetical protein